MADTSTYHVAEQREYQQSLIRNEGRKVCESATREQLGKEAEAGYWRLFAAGPSLAPAKLTGVFESTWLARPAEADALRAIVIAACSPSAYWQDKPAAPKSAWPLQDNHATENQHP
jgi:hypothetical protein